MTTSPENRAENGAAPPTRTDDRYLALAEARRYSQRVLAQIRDLLTPLADRAPDVLGVSISGSLGRHEAGPHSDADLIVVIGESEAAAPAMEAVWEELAPLGLPRPKPTGVFATPVTRAALLDPSTLGRVVEDVAVFGKRMQLLLDAQPVYGDPSHVALLRDILVRYATGLGDGSSYLLHDLIRYHRCLCLEALADFGLRGGGWYVRNLKVRHSRVVMFAALLFLLGAGGDVASRLAYSPLERIADIYRTHADPHFARVATAYDRILAGLNDSTVRAELAAAAPTRAGELGLPPPAYVALSSEARLLTAELVRFLLTRRTDWGERFFEALLF